MKLIFVVTLMMHGGMHAWHFVHSLQCHQYELLSSEEKLNFYNCVLVGGVDVCLVIKTKQNIKPPNTSCDAGRVLNCSYKIPAHGTFCFTS